MSERKKTLRWSRTLKAGSWVVVRDKDQIVATLGENASIDGLPFQPEMFEFCGRRMKVAKVAHKTCDNIEKTGGRKLEYSYHLEGARCDGSYHDGCQADCVFIWKADWLRPDDKEAPEIVQDSEGACTVERVFDSASLSIDDDAPGDLTWVCQTTKLFEATELLHWWDVRQYVRDVTSGNHTAWHIIKLLLLSAYRRFVDLGPGYRIKIKLYDLFQGLRGGKPFPEIHGAVQDGSPTPSERTDLKVGEWVEVKSPAEIAETLTEDGLFNRGMRYDPEMLKYCGNRYRVEMRVDRLINEVTGKMMEMKNPCVQLEDVYCRAECTEKRLGCPRASNTYWREIWLRRVDGPSSEPVRRTD